MTSREQCRQMTEKFNKYFPCGHSNLKVPTAPGSSRTFIQKAQGGRLWDVDGNEIMDFVCAFGPNILGHGHPEYVAALKDHLDTFSPSMGTSICFTQDDIDLAEKIVKYVPCAEKIKFALSGSDAIQTALRICRAFTGRNRFVRFEHHYHGWFDNVIAGVADKDADPPLAIFGCEDDGLDTAGRAKSAVEESFLLPFNDIEALEKVLAKYGDDIAVVVMEGIAANNFNQMPKEGFLERVRELCDQYGILLLFDEVITGFRMGLSGVQGVLPVKPDLATFGKAMAGGLPVSCVAGRADVLDVLTPAGGVLGPGTFNGYSLGMRAALTTLSILERDNGACYKEMERVQGRMVEEMRGMIKRRGLPICITSITGCFYTICGVDPDTVVYTDDDIASCDWDMLSRFWTNLYEEGVLIMSNGRWYPSIATTDADVDKTMEATDRALARLS